MFVVTQKSFELGMTLSSGSHKLYNVAQLEPAATTARYATLIGYTERSTRKFITELEVAGLVQRVQPTRRDQPTATIEQEQTEIMRELTDFGVALQKARALARQYPEEIIREQMMVVRGTRDVINAPGLLIYRLKSYVPTPASDEHEAASSAAVEEVVQPNESELGTVAEVLAAHLVPDQTSTLSAVLSEDTVPSPERSLTTLSFSSSALLLDKTSIELVLLAYAVQMATGLDIRFNEASRQTTYRLYELGYKADDVAVFADCVFTQADWRGQKGERPVLKDLEAYISSVRMRDWSGTGIWCVQSKLRIVHDYLKSTESYRFRSLAELGQAAQDWDSELDNAAFLERQVEARRAKSQRRPDYAGSERQAWDAVRYNPTAFSVLLRQMIVSLRLISVFLDSTSNVETFVVEVDDEGKRDYVQRNAAHTIEQILVCIQKRPCKVQLVVALHDDEAHQ